VIAPKRSFVVNVASLRGHPGQKLSRQLEAEMEGLEGSWAQVPQGAAVRVQLDLEAASGGIVAVGSIRAPWVGECRRCLGPAQGELDIEVAELFVEKASGIGDEELVYFFTGEQLDLAPMIRELVILELPTAPLCRPDCAGLCPRCGAELANGPCSCKPEIDPRWVALSQLYGGEFSLS
jgi:uncharacterized protein